MHPSGPPYIESFAAQPAWHYATLMVHHLIGLAEQKEYATLDDNWNPTSGESPCVYIDLPNRLGSLGELGQFQRRIPKFNWKWHPLTKATWKEVFDYQPIEVTVRRLADLLLVVPKLCPAETKKNCIVKLSPRHADIYRFASSQNEQEFHYFAERYEKLLDLTPDPNLNLQQEDISDIKNFLSLEKRREFFSDTYSLLLLSFIDMDQSNYIVQLEKIRDEVYLETGRRPPPFKSIDEPENQRWKNLSYEVIATTLLHCNLHNPFLNFILTQVLSDWSSDVRGKFIHYFLKPNIVCDTNRLRVQIFSHELLESFQRSTSQALTEQYRKRLQEAPTGTNLRYDLALSSLILESSKDGIERRLPVAICLVVRFWKINNLLQRSFDWKTDSEETREHKKLWMKRADYILPRAKAWCKQHELLDRMLRVIELEYKALTDVNAKSGIKDAIKYWEAEKEYMSDHYKVFLIDSKFSAKAIDRFIELDIDDLISQMLTLQDRHLTDKLTEPFVPGLVEWDLSWLYFMKGYGLWKRLPESESESEKPDIRGYLQKGLEIGEGLKKDYLEKRNPLAKDYVSLLIALACFESLLAKVDPKR